MGSRKPVLLFHDQPDLIERLIKWLTKRGHEVHAARSLPEGRDYIAQIVERKLRYAGAVLDVMVPSLTEEQLNATPNPTPLQVQQSLDAGLILAREIRGKYGLSPQMLPLLFTTVRPDNEVRRQIAALSGVHQVDWSQGYGYDDMINIIERHFK